MIVKAARDNLDKAAEELVNAFERKFSERTDVSFDVTGIALAAVIGGAVTFVTGGAYLPIAESAVAGAWTDTFNQAAKNLHHDNKQGSVHAPGGSISRTPTCAPRPTSSIRLSTRSTASTARSMA
jgi:hypothetical protein